MRIYIPMLLVAMSLGCAIQDASQGRLSGTWVLRFRDQNLAVLRMDDAGQSGVYTRPSKIEGNQEGYFTSIGGDVVEQNVLVVVDEGVAEESSAALRLRIDTESGPEIYVVQFSDQNHLEMRPAGMPAWVAGLQLERWEQSRDAVLGTDWSEPPLASPELERVRDRLLEMAEADQVPRLKTPLDYAEIDRVDTLHRAEIEQIYADYGWPSRSLIGYNAAIAFWQLVQHQDLDLQAQWMPEMEKLVEAGEASMQHYSLLFDRVMLRQGKAQRWGNGGDCENGVAVLKQPVEDPEHLNDRRAELHLLPIEDYLTMLAPQCAAVAASPPSAE